MSMNDTVRLHYTPLQGDHAKPGEIHVREWLGCAYPISPVVRDHIERVFTNFWTKNLYDQLRYSIAKGGTTHCENTNGVVAPFVKHKHFGFEKLEGQAGDGILRKNEGFQSITLKHQAMGVKVTTYQMNMIKHKDNEREQCRDRQKQPKYKTQRNIRRKKWKTNKKNIEPTSYNSGKFLKFDKNTYKTKTQIKLEKQQEKERKKKEKAAKKKKRQKKQIKSKQKSNKPRQNKQKKKGKNKNDTNISSNKRNRQTNSRNNKSNKNNTNKNASTKKSTKASINKTSIKTTKENKNLNINSKSKHQICRNDSSAKSKDYSSTCQKHRKRRRTGAVTWQPGIVENNGKTTKEYRRTWGRKR